MRPFQFSKAVKASTALVDKKGNTQYIAGGTNLVDLMKKHIAQPDKLIDITAAISNKIETTSSGIKIGAMVRNTVLTTNPIIVGEYPLIAKAVLAGASPQIRNMASTGGNLLQRTRCTYFYDVTMPCNKRQPGTGCGALNGVHRMGAVVGYSDACVAVHPSDLCVALAALDATVNTTDSKNPKIEFKDFHRLPGNTPELDNNLPANALITSIEIKKNTFHKNCAYVKLRDRDSYAFALVSVAAALQLDGNKIIAARLASGGVAHKPWRWYDAETFLQGKNASAATFTAAAEMVVQSIQPLSGNAFKKQLLKGALETALHNSLKT